MSDLTIAIVAYNSERTIGRAVRSAVAAGDHSILLVDDGSTDDTVQQAKLAGGPQLSVVQLPSNKGVGAARAEALSWINTKYGMWLDADDEITPNRPDDMLTALRAGADIVYDGGVLIDGASGEELKTLQIPDFMFEDKAELRCFERNWYPILAGGFRVLFAQKVGFDRHFQCSEDYDFLLRAIEKDAVVRPLRTIGYRYFHEADSTSRNLRETRKNVQVSLEKHPVEKLETLILGGAFLAAEEKYCLLAGMSLYRQDYDAVFKFAKKVSNRQAVIAPYGLEAGLYADFVVASAFAAQEKWQSAHTILEAMTQGPSSADVWNNLGVALHRIGQKRQAMLAFQKALTIMPGYQDATRNMAGKKPQNWTTHPLRRQLSRDDYSL